MMALEIARKAVDAQLADILPGMGIKVKYKIADGKVKLHLTRTFRIISLPRFFVQTSFYTQSNL